MNTIEAIENTIRHSEKFQIILEEYSPSSQSTMTREDFHEEFELILDGLFTQIEHHENRTRAALEEAERLNSAIKERT